jgi:HK97 family phage portal protein
MSNKSAKSSRVKSAVLNWLGFGLTDVEQWQILYGRDSKSGTSVTADNAMTLAAVWACVRLVAQTIATLPVGVYRATETGREYVQKHPLNRVIRFKASNDMTATVFWECIAASAILRGNGFAEIERSGARIVGLDFLHPDRLTWRKLQAGGYEFTYIDDFGVRRVIDERDIFHVPGFTTCGPFGMSVIKYGVEVLGSALAANQAASSTFKNGLLPTTYFKMEKLLTPAQREEFRENLKELAGSLNAGKQPLLEGGMDVGTVGINPKDAQLLETRAFTIEEVCRWFGVPPSMVGHTDKASSWASSAESLNLWFLQYGLRPWLKRIESSIWDRLLTPAEQADHYAEFNVEGLLRADTSGRTSFYSTALQNGWMSRNEVRRLENLPPVEGGDTYTAQSNLLPLDQLGGQGADSNAVRSALLNWLREPEVKP